MSRATRTPHRLLTSLLTTISITSACALADTSVQTTEELQKEATEKVTALASGLKTALQSAMQSGGPSAAVTACNLQAPVISESTSTEQWLVGRTSLKSRNSSNQPDAWEKEVLLGFEAKLASGTPIQQLQHDEIIEKNGKQIYRYMKAIPTQALCLKCHGKADQIDAGLLEKIKTLYPDDEAMGFSEGEIRGAFTLTKDL